ncbi:hypothetical protein [Capsulimonas corticalis]|uniref:hypothetical protein n=1 Tax=Capsulimonas corticalis TaxID=2219043 RepID=UPI000E64A7AC|nr:hypothetical protein [Capsulimonas corticalis]
MNIQQQRELPFWSGAAVVIVALFAIVLYGVHVLRPQAPNSDLKMPTSYHAPQNLPNGTGAPVHH